MININSILYTDEATIYNNSKRYVGSHEQVNHSIEEYARGDVTINHCENFFSLLKRGITGSFHHVSPWHLQKYCDEFCFRYGYRKADDADRTIAALARMEGKRLLYKTPIRRVF